MMGVRISARQLLFVFTAIFLLFFSMSASAEAFNVLQYKDTLSDSGPSEQSNHAIEFVINTAVSPGGVIEVTPPSGFTILSTTTFGVRNVELYVNGTPRTATSSPAPGIDGVSITTGSPGKIIYTLAPDSGVSKGDLLQLRIGNNTSNSLQFSQVVSTSTGTTTTPADIEPIINSSTLGRHDVQVDIYDGGLIASADPVIYLVQKVSIPSVDTTEEIPPFRFNGSPTTTVGGTTLSVEISLETDEFAICKFDTASGTPYALMPVTFDNTGLIFHTTVVAVTPNSFQQFFVRCIDDEGNFNIDDYLIAFAVNDQPTGQSNTEGDVEGSGTGSGNDGTGDGSGSGGTTGDSNGEQPEAGSEEGTGGGGGGGGGGNGRDEGGTSGGGFESSDAPFPSGDGRVIISGYAFPNSTVTILVDGNLYETTKAGSSGSYSITIDGIARGAYTFGVYASGPDNVKSSTFSTSFTVTGSRTSSLSNINVAPSILVRPDPVEPGQQVTFSGYGLPNATIEIQNGRINTTGSNLQTTSNSSGQWQLSVSTSGFSVDTYQVRARSVQVGGVGITTNYSEYTFYGVGQDADVPLNADLNRDGRVNLTDFSILLFWWNSNGGDSDPPADINRDGRVNLTDFSIMLFNWTG